MPHRRSTLSSLTMQFYRKHEAQFRKWPKKNRNASSQNRPAHRWRRRPKKYCWTSYSLNPSEANTQIQKQIVILCRRRDWRIDIIRFPIRQLRTLLRTLNEIILDLLCNQHNINYSPFVWMIAKFVCTNLKNRIRITESKEKITNSI